MPDGVSTIGGYPLSICYGDNMFVVPLCDSNNVLYSEDGIHWDFSSINDANETREWMAATYGDGKFVITAPTVDYDGCIISYSNDGVNWTEITKPNIFNGMDNTAYPYVCYGNGKFLIVPIYDSFENNDIPIGYSEDGVNWNWTSVQLTTDAGLCWPIGVCYTGNKFMLLDGYYGLLFSSSDSVNWTEPVYIANEHEFNQLGGMLEWICCGGGIIFAGNTYGCGSYMYSLDGVEWHFVENTISVANVLPQPICFGKGLFVTATANGNLYTMDRKCLKRGN